MTQAGRNMGGGGFGTERDPDPGIKNAYEVLGLSEEATDDEVKKAYRHYMNQYHPDKLVSKGLPEEMMKFATEKTQKIKAAYDQIKKVRNIA
jgi:DnaJ like chaperone protein